MTLKLSPRQRTVFILRCQEGLTNNGVAHRLGLSFQTIKNHVTLALAGNQMHSTAEMCWALAQEEADVPA